MGRSTGRAGEVITSAEMATGLSLQESHSLVSNDVDDELVYLEVPNPAEVTDKKVAEEWRLVLHFILWYG